jgi:hypothetical protein
MQLLPQARIREGIPGVLILAGWGATLVHKGLEFRIP